MQKLESCLCLSGGGYCAATYHLGTMSYLWHLKMKDGSRFLETVKVMSTISGGTITGLWYMMNLCKGIETDESFRKLYSILYEADIPQMEISRYLQNQDGRQSLIQVLSDVYDDIFFHNECFNLILDNIDNVHLDYFTSNASDFYKALPFRFQAVKASMKEKPDECRGIIGNYHTRISKEIASQIRLSEILAASSCFPGVFEPIIFPDDFKLYESEKNRQIMHDLKFEPVSLMDGGITDNQGFDYLDIAKKQMDSDAIGPDSDDIDLAIVSDVSRRQIKHRKENEPMRNKWWNRISIRGVVNIIHTVTVGSLIGAVLCFIFHYVYWCGFLSSFFMVCCVISYVFEKKLLGKFKKILFRHQLNHYERLFMKIKFFNFVNLIFRRIDSVRIMISGRVFFKRIRRISYHNLFSDENWRYRRIAFQIHKLNMNGEWNEKMKKDSLPDWMNVPVIVQQSILDCEEQLKMDWEKFKTNPKWLFDERIKPQK